MLRWIWAILKLAHDAWILGDPRTWGVAQLPFNPTVSMCAVMKPDAKSGLQVFPSSPLPGSLYDLLGPASVEHQLGAGIAGLIRSSLFQWTGDQQHWVTWGLAKDPQNVRAPARPKTLPSAAPDIRWHNSEGVEVTCLNFRSLKNSPFQLFLLFRPIHEEPPFWAPATAIPCCFPSLFLLTKSSPPAKVSA